MATSKRKAAVERAQDLVTVSDNLLEPVPAVEVAGIMSAANAVERDLAAVSPNKQAVNPSDVWYCLFVNDESVPYTPEGSTRTQYLPHGTWYVTYINFYRGVIHGPYAMFVPTNTGMKEVSGFVQDEILRNYAYSEFLRHSNDRWADPIDKFVVDGRTNKIMSKFIYHA
jgi:hypothetical protein